MANIRSAEKQRRQAEKANERNRAGLHRLRAQLKRAKKTIGDAAGDLAPVLTTAYSEIDTAKKKKLIKENTANRYKSRLAKAVKRTSAK